MSQPTIRTQIRLEMLRSSDRLRAASEEVAEAIEALDRGDFYEDRLGNALIEASIAQAQMHQARGMQRVASLSSEAVLR